MVLVLSDKENKIEKEIAEMLKELSTSAAKDKGIHPISSDFTAVFIHQDIYIDAKCGIVIATDNLKKFKNQRLPKSFIGVCDENNKNALKFFKSNNIYTLVKKTIVKPGKPRLILLILVINDDNINRECKAYPSLNYGFLTSLEGGVDNF